MMTMTTHDAWRKRLLWAVVALLALAVIVPRAISWATSRDEEDDSRELLRQALEPSPTAPRLVEGDRTRVEATTSSGEAIQAELTALKNERGKVVGHLPRLQQPPKPGETTTIKLPGGGSLEIKAAPAGSPVPTTITAPGGRP